MIEAISDLFVERVPRPVARPVLATACRLLVVDACGEQRRIADLTAHVEGSAPLTASYVELGRIDHVPAGASFEFVWLFVDERSDLSYCGLYTRELRERFDGAGIETIGVGELDAAECSVVLTSAMAGAAPPWRRRRELAAGAARLAEAMPGARGVPA